MGKVYLVGAGPGDKKLITVRGMELLKTCDAVVYDRLASEDLLAEVRNDCHKIYVGKYPGHHSKKQDEINEILVNCGREYEIVVRLKGGDPFVFGRGPEEIEALEANQISYEVIPGITSAIAVPEWVGIPLTNRGISRSFHVMTGHTNSEIGIPEYDYTLLAKSEGTLVFLMGLSNIEIITTELMRAGKEKNTPVAVISQGTTAAQKVVRGTLSSIVSDIKRGEMTSPAIIVIGETAACSYIDKKKTRKIGVTATNILYEKIQAECATYGWDVCIVCDMKVMRTKEIERLRQEFEHIANYQWILFTSQNAVTIFFEELATLQIDVRRLGTIKFAALGSGTAEKLKQYGIYADFIPSKYTVAVFADEFVKQIEKGERIMIPRAVQGSKVLTDVLKKEKIIYTEIPIYDVIGKSTPSIYNLEKLDSLFFLSASGVQAFFQQLRKAGVTLPAHIKIACIGDITKDAVQKEHGEVNIVALQNNVESLLEEVSGYFSRNK